MENQAIPERYPVEPPTILAEQRQFERHRPISMDVVLLRDIFRAFIHGNRSMAGIVNEEDDLDGCIHLVDDSLLREKEHVSSTMDRP